jgi:hypothetical protein
MKKLQQRLLERIDEIVAELGDSFEQLSELAHKITSNRCADAEDLSFQHQVALGGLTRTAAALCPAHVLLLERLALELLDAENDEGDDIELPQLPHGGGPH